MNDEVATAVGKYIAVHISFSRDVIVSLHKLDTMHRITNKHLFEIPPQTTTPYYSFKVVPI